MIRPLLLLSPDEAAVMACVLQPWADELGLQLDASGRVDPGWLAWAFANKQLGVSTDGAATLLQGLRAVDMLQMGRAGPDRPRIRDLIRDGRLCYDRRDNHEHWQTYGELVGQIADFGALDVFLPRRHPRALPGLRAPRALPGLRLQRGHLRRPSLGRSGDGIARGDCEDLGAAWAAELAVDGWDPDAVPVAFESRPGLSHVVVRSLRYGDIDPSRLAGMGRE